MKNSLCFLILALTIAPIDVATQAAASATPRKVASQFYTLLLREKPSGLPDRRETRRLRPYLSKSLRNLFSRARKEQAAYIRLNPGNKPPWIEGSLFSCSFEGFNKFRVGKTRTSGRFAYIDIDLNMEPYGDASWTDKLVLKKENRRWVVWDVEMGCTWPFRMGPTLRKMLAD